MLPPDYESAQKIREYDGHDVPEMAIIVHILAACLFWGIIAVVLIVWLT